MASYDEITSLIGPLKRAAIDAWMKSHSGGAWQIDGDKYRIDSRGTDFSVTRPGENGEGGGNWEASDFLGDLFGLVDRDDEFMGAFDDIRATIDDALDKWTWIPDPANIAPLVEAMRQANSTLALGAVVSDGTVTGGGRMAGDINLIMGDMAAMRGGMITAFKSNFLAQMSRAIGGQHALTTILGGHLAAQQGMWEGARQSAVDLVVKYTDAFEAAAAGGSVDWELVLQILGYASAGVGLFAAAGAKTTIGVADLGLKIASEQYKANKGATPAPGGDYDSVMAAFKRDVEQMSTDVRTEEEAIAENCRTNLRYVNSDRDSYDIPRPDVLDVDDGDDLHYDGGRREEIRIDRLAVDEVANTYLKNIASELQVAHGHISDALTYNGEAWHRSSDIGMGTYGPSSEWFDLWIVLRDLVGNLREEVHFGRQAFALAVRDLHDADAASQRALDTVHDRIEAAGVGTPSGGHNPWDQIPDDL